MTRIPVPEAEFEEYDRITVAGYNDHHYGDADVNLDHRAHGPLGLRVDRDDDGLYVGCNPDYAAEVVEYLNDEFDMGLDLTDDAEDAEAEGEGDEGQTESESEPNGEADTAEDVAETQGDSSAHEGDSPQDAESGASADASEDTADGSDDADDDDEPASDGDDDPGTCQHVLTSGDRDGEVCGRDLPCPYHDDT